MGLLLAHPGRPAAHEVPSDVTVRGFVRPEGRTLRFLVRVPLEAMRDIEFPTRGAGYLDLPRAAPSLRHAARMWVGDYVSFRERGVRLGRPELVAVRASLPSDPSFARYEEALAHVTGPPLADDVEIVWEQAVLDALFELPIESADSRFSIDSELDHLGLRTLTILRFVPPGGEGRTFRFVGDPGLVRLDPTWAQATGRFFESGVLELLRGLDYVLFLVVLVLPFRTLRALLPIPTAFVVGASITLVGSAAGLAPAGLWFEPLVRALLAASILLVAIENVFGARLGRRWAIAFGFGLVHGLGLAFPLRDTLQFAGSHAVASLVAFDLGLALGALVLALAAAPVLEGLFGLLAADRRRASERPGASERFGILVLCAIIGHAAWHRMTERLSHLLQHRVPRPALGTGTLADLMGWLMLLLVAGGAAWVLHRLMRRFTSRSGTDGGESAAAEARRSRAAE